MGEDNMGMLEGIEDFEVEDDHFDDVADGIEDAGEDPNKSRSAGGKTRGIDVDDPDGDNNSHPNEEVETEEEEETKKPGRFTFASGFVASVATAGKEYLASTVLGDDLGEHLVEKQETSAEEAAENSGTRGKTRG